MQLVVINFQRTNTGLERVRILRGAAYNRVVSPTKRKQFFFQVRDDSQTMKLYLQLFAINSQNIVTGLEKTI